MPVTMVTCDICPGEGHPGGRNGGGEGWNGSWRPQLGGLQPGVGGMLRTGEVLSRSVRLIMQCA